MSQTYTFLGQYNYSRKYKEYIHEIVLNFKIIAIKHTFIILFSRPQDNWFLSVIFP